MKSSVSDETEMLPTGLRKVVLGRHTISVIHLCCGPCDPWLSLTWRHVACRLITGAELSNGVKGRGVREGEGGGGEREGKGKGRGRGE